jgi:hypothetical protein
MTGAPKTLIPDIDYAFLSVLRASVVKIPSFSQNETKLVTFVPNARNISLFLRLSYHVYYAVNGHYAVPFAARVRR